MTQSQLICELLISCSTNSSVTYLLTYSLIHPLVPTALRHHHTQTVRDRYSSYKIDYFIVIKNFLNPKGHQNPIRGLKRAAVLLKGWILVIGVASAGEDLRLQSALRACLHRCNFLT